ncbi:MAG: hypothetical protein ACO239_00450 [Sediminibacterium sp.]
MANVLDRVSSNFDTTKFGDDINLSTQAKNFLNTNPIEVKTWIKNDLINGPISATDYFQNPVATYVSSITSNVNSIISVCTDDPDTNFPNANVAIKNLANSANSFLVQLNNFLDHTNRISNVTDDILDPVTGDLLPNYSMCISTGGMLTTITANTDGTDDASVILKNFTSLYIEEELSANSWSIGNSTVFLTTVANVSTTTSEINQIEEKLNVANTMIYARRTADENYFYSSQQLLNEYQFLDSLQRSGSTERNLIQNKIGTTKLKNSLFGS